MNSILRAVATALGAPMLAGTLSMASAAQTMKYPETPRGPVVDDYFGTPVADPYRWLEDLDAAQTRSWIDAQNGLTLPFLAKLEEREDFRQRLTRLWNYERYGRPSRSGNALFWLRNDGLQNQSVLYVQDPPAAAPRVLLDPNQLSADGTVALTQYEASPDGRWLAYGTAAAGSDWNELRIRKVATGEDAAEVLTRVKFSEPSWTRDNAGFFYSRYPLATAPDAQGLNRTVFDELANQKIYYHRLGQPQSQDRLAYEAPAQPKWFLNGTVSDDGRYLFITINEGSGEENQLHYIDLKDPQQPRFDGPVLQLVGNFEHSHQVIGNRGSRLFVLTNREAPNKKIVSFDLAASATVTSVVAESTDPINAATMAGGELVVLRMHDAASRLARYALDGKPLAEIVLPALGTVAGLSTTDPDDPELFFDFTSFNTPSTNYRVDLKDGKARVFQALKLAFDPAEYVTEQVFYTSRDGTRVPMFISYRKGLKRDGKAQSFLHGYGGFNIPKTPAFDVSALAWMQKGGVYAVANLRGGSEYGEAWHRAGTKAAKQNVFDDFRYAGRYLAEQHYSSGPRTAIWGRSNGGLLVGASVNQHPEAWGAAVATVGVMDMLRYDRFTVGYAWRGDYGSAQDAEGFRYLSAYSPLQTVRAGTRYPPTLITTGDHDDRVHPSHSYKYAAALQAAQAGDAPVLIRIDTRAGHGSGKPISKLIEEEADKLGFMWHYTNGKPMGGPDGR